MYSISSLYLSEIQLYEQHLLILTSPTFFCILFHSLIIGKLSHYASILDMRGLMKRKRSFGYFHLSHCKGFVWKLNLNMGHSQSRLWAIVWTLFKMLFLDIFLPFLFKKLIYHSNSLTSTPGIPSYRNPSKCACSHPNRM